ncbi:ATP-binding protein [Saccharopolyspora sp. K220]|uniref:AAA family ATPase n=1 Tax=Saccharopolyspora soli TaxID=2926618 RepID=UPI001F5691C1|nr:AAA family ATPase [Saccharopolyspora soli]MCI2418438.1 ATP-binding protein [Saccharopolyspora soli]
MSGLPGSGKSTLSTALGDGLAMPVISKDVILEALFDSLGVGDHAWRHRLSRSADEILLAVAASANRAVLDNWWHHDSAPDRLRQLNARLIEVYCDCDVEVACARFRARVDRIRKTFPGPLRLGGPLFVVDTTSTVDISSLLGEIR